MADNMNPPPANQSRLRAPHTLLLAICVITVLIRITIFLLLHQPADIPGLRFDSRNMRPDSATYILPALSLLRTGAFSKNLEPNAPPELMRTPGYPVFIASTSGASENNLVLLVGLAQILLSALTIYLCGLIAFQLFGRLSATAAAAILALDPVSFLYTQLILSDSLFATFLALHAFFVLSLLQPTRREFFHAFTAGITLAIATHIRPISYYLIVPVCIGLFCAKAFPRKSFMRAFALASITFAAWAPLVIGWQIRNHGVAGIREFSAIKNHNLLFYRGAGIISRVEKIPFDKAQQILEQRAPDSARASIAAWNAHCRAEGARLLREHPYPAFKDSALGVIRLLVGPGNKSIAQYFGGGLPFLQIYSTIYLAILYSLILAAILRKRRQLLDARHIFLLGVIVYLILVAAGPEANSRFRVAFTPILSIYAGAGMAWLLSGRQRT